MADWELLEIARHQLRDLAVKGIKGVQWLCLLSLGKKAEKKVAKSIGWIGSEEFIAGTINHM